MDREEVLILAGWSTLVWAASHVFGRGDRRSKADEHSAPPKESTQCQFFEDADFAISAQVLEGKHVVRTVCKVAARVLCMVEYCITTFDKPPIHEYG